jgi:hypothetical protein
MTDWATSDYWPLPFAPLQALLDYWLAKRGPRRCPDKADIDPTEIGSLLPHIVLLDAAPPGGEFRYRLAGSRVTQMNGRELRGLTQRELHDNPTDPVVVRGIARIEAEFAWVARAFKGGFRTVRLALPGRDHIELARLILPLTDNGAAAQHMVMVMVDIGTSPLSARIKGGVNFGIDLESMVPIAMPPEVEALATPNFIWPMAKAW